MGLLLFERAPGKLQKHRVFWVLLMKYDKFSGKLTRIVHFCAKMCQKNHAFSTRFELLTQCLTTNEYDPSLNCAVGSIARQVGHDQCFPFWAKTNEIQTRHCFAVWMFLKVSTSKQSNQIEAIGYGIASIWTSPGKIAKTQGFLSFADKVW